MTSSTDRVLILSIDLDYSVGLRTFMRIAQIRQEGLCRRKSSGNAGDLSFFAGERVKALKCGWHPRNAGELESLNWRYSQVGHEPEPEHIGGVVYNRWERDSYKLLQIDGMIPYEQAIWCIIYQIIVNIYYFYEQKCKIMLLV